MPCDNSAIGNVSIDYISVFACFVSVVCLKLLTEGGKKLFVTFLIHIFVLKSN